MCTVCKLISILNVWMLCYTGNVQTFTAPSATTYKLEVWGAQGGSYLDLIMVEKVDIVMETNL